MSDKGSILALRSHGADTIALSFTPEAVDDLHTLIGKARHIIGTLPDQDLVLKVDYKATVLSLLGIAYETELKVGLKRTCIDVWAVDAEESTASRFWPMWDDERVVFPEDNNPDSIARFREEFHTIIDLLN